VASLFGCALRRRFIDKCNSTTNKTMRTKTQKLTTLFCAAIAFATMQSLAQAANLSGQDKKFLASYEKIHTALAADDLTVAKSAAAELGDLGSDIAKANSLKDARAGFEKLSARAKTIAAGQSGYHVAHCPMLNKDWVQPSTTISNPYGGKEMVSCGEIKK